MRHSRFTRAITHKANLPLKLARLRYLGLMCGVAPCRLPRESSKAACQHDSNSGGREGALPGSENEARDAEVRPAVPRESGRAGAAEVQRQDRALAGVQACDLGAVRRPRGLHRRRDRHRKSRKGTAQAFCAPASSFACLVLEAAEFPSALLAPS